MRVLIHSAPPGVPAGYSSHTENLIEEFGDGHEIGILPPGDWIGAGIEHEGIPIHARNMGGPQVDSLRYWYEEGDYDVVISHLEHWGQPDRFARLSEDIPFIMYTVVDQCNPDNTLPYDVVRATEESFRPTFHSEWAYECAMETGYDPETTWQIPHGIDTDKYAPVTDHIDQGRLKEQMGIPHDATLYALVGGNNGVREGMPEMMHAFKKLITEHGRDDAYLFVHSHPIHSNGHNLHTVRDVLNLNDRVLFPDAGDMAHGIPDGAIIRLYNTADVVLNVSRGDSWGMVVTEAMACGTPVIAANHSALTEQFGKDPDYTMPRGEPYRPTDYGILVNRGSPEWTQRQKSRRFVPHVDDIAKAMLYYDVHDDVRETHGQNARAHVVSNYNLETVYANQWSALLEEIKQEL